MNRSSPLHPEPLPCEEVRRLLVSFLREATTKAGAEGVVLGLSGGVDSSVVCALGAEALGPDRVRAILLPAPDSNPKDERDARLVADHFGVAVERIPIGAILESALSSCPSHPPSPGAVANLKARIRMIVLYAHANTEGLLVAGTGNKSELLTGYFTKYGDGAADLFPLGDLYKTEVLELARHVGVPSEVVEKPPTAGLFPGQTDEGELGVPYGILDPILRGIEGGWSSHSIARALSVPLEVVEGIRRRVVLSEHKRRPLLVPKLGFRTAGLDWRSPRLP